jgi:amino acid adenylation domain-containing protein
LSPLKHDTETVKFDLVLYMTYSGSELTGSFAYNTDLFDAETIKRMVGHFQTLLQGIVADPDRRLSSLPFLTEAEERLRVERNETKVEYPQDKCLHELFEAQAVRTPNDIAVVFEKQHLTYAELNARANQLAHYLRGLGVGPETLVGICMERSMNMVIGLLGILKAGGAYVPLEPTYPKERLSFMLQDTKTPVLLTQKGLVESMPCHQAKVVCLDTDWNQIAQESTQNPVSGATAGNLAYVIYTSGSTGTPKGVLVDHQNVARLFEATDNWFHFDKSDVWTFFHSYAFDFSVWELWGALLYGGRLVLVPYWVSRSPEAFYDLLCTEQVTVLNQTPSAFRQLIQAENSLPAPKELALRFVIFGGEALELESLKPWFGCHMDQSPRLINMYGITETTVHVTYFPLRADLRATGSVIGVRIPDLSVHVLNQHLQPVPEKIAGEVFVGGAGLGRGYLNRPELTAERFIPNPFASKLGERLYKSGDLARYSPDGNLEYVGRVDHQVKIRGFRIELGEIETVLRQHGAVQEALVVAREDVPGERLLVAYVVPRSKSALEAEQAWTISDRLISELRSFLKERLPEYMVPAAFVMLDALPLTPNGKVDRRALPIPTTQRPVLETDYAEPQSGLEQTIAGIWQEVLNVERVGVHDNFFDLGGHSLLLTRAHARLKRVLNRDFPVIAMFRYPTIDTLAKFLRPDVHSSPEPLEVHREKLIAGRDRRERVFQKRKIAEQSKKSK